jgi:hypothetical protein
MAIQYLPGWTWHYQRVGDKIIDRWATDPQGNVYTVRQTQNIQKQRQAEAGQPRPAPQPRVGRRYTRRTLSERHGRVTEIYFNDIDQAQEEFQRMCEANDPRVTAYSIWVVQALYTGMVAQRDTNTAKAVPRTVTYTERGVEKTRRITQERASLSKGYYRRETMCENDEPWDEAREREENFTIRRIVLFGAER